jgi:hypothetical protein
VFVVVCDVFCLVVVVGALGLCVCVCWFLNLALYVIRLTPSAKSAVTRTSYNTSLFFFLNFREERRIMDFGWFENIMRGWRERERETWWCCCVVFLVVFSLVWSDPLNCYV